MTMILERIAVPAVMEVLGWSVTVNEVHMSHTVCGGGLHVALVDDGTGNEDSWSTCNRQVGNGNFGCTM